MTVLKQKPVVNKTIVSTPLLRVSFVLFVDGQDRYYLPTVLISVEIPLKILSPVLFL
jgi:hypothetical protein